MTEAIEVLEAKYLSIISCLNDKNWCAKDNDYERKVRSDFVQKEKELAGAIKLLKEHVSKT